MKILISLVVLCGLGFSPQAGAAARLIEMGLEKVYVPRVGYDDNDQIEAVLTGELPNPCYSLAYSVVQVMPDGKTRLLRQYAWKNEDGACGTGDLIEDPVPFTSTVALGSLEQGNYRVDFRKELGGSGTRSFEVEKAKSDLTDNFEYAVVRGIDVVDATFEGSEIRAMVSGLMTNTCAQMDMNAKAELVDDVFIVLPTVKNVAGENCRHALKPFKKEISLGIPKAGTYLLHVRSRDGKALYRPLLIWKKNS